MSSSEFSAESNPEKAPTDKLLEVRGLRIDVNTRSGRATPVESVSFTIARGERIAVVGESGSGKSLTATAIMGLTGYAGADVIEPSSIVFDGLDLLSMTKRQRRELRGGRMAMIFQDPLTSLNPMKTVGAQVAEAARLHNEAMSVSDVKSLTEQLFEQVRLPRVHSLFDSYPHQLSGGMRQRVMIAMALAGNPELLIADEPTTALDVTVQAEILDLLRDICDARGLAVLIITHDLSMIAGFADKVVVMRQGRVVEQGTTTSIFHNPTQPYTRALIASIPRVDQDRERLVTIEDVMEQAEGAPKDPGPSPEQKAQSKPSELTRPTVSSEPVLEASHVSMRYRVKSRTGKVEFVQALDDVSLKVYEGQSLGIIGQSGSGKSTLARCFGALSTPTSGEVSLHGRNVNDMGRHEMKGFRREMQMVFQDPSSSLDPRMRVRDILLEPLRVHGIYRQNKEAAVERVEELLEAVKLPADSIDRYPREFSGGQRQRIAIARALVTRPKVLICDEPVSALDVSVRASILNLLADLKEEFGLTLVFIAHDVALVKFLCDTVGVMYEGELVEYGTPEEVFANPQHPHTRSLVESQPIPDPELEIERAKTRAVARRKRATAMLSI